MPEMALAGNLNYNKYIYFLITPMDETWFMKDYIFQTVHCHIKRRKKC